VLASLTDIINALQTCVRTGQVVIGSRKTIKLAMHGKAKLIVLASNAPPEIKRDIKYYAKLSKIPVLEIPSTNIELGTIVGKPFGVSSMAIINPGQSNILDLVKEVEKIE